MGINEIIEKAEVAKASFYQHFPSKQDLCAAWLREEAARERERCQSVLASKLTVRRKLLEEALKLHERILLDYEDDPMIILKTARAYSSLAYIYHLIGQRVEAEKAYNQALELLAKLLEDDPRNEEYSEELANLRSLLALLKNKGLPDKGALFHKFLIGADDSGVLDVAAGV